MTMKNENRVGYKNIKVGWIPEEWECLHLFQCGNVLFSNVDKKTSENEIPVRMCNYTDVYYNNKIVNSMQFMEATANAAQIEKFSLYKYDLIITKDSESADDIAVPTFVSEELDNVICGYHLAIIRSNRKILIGEFLVNLLQSHSYKHYFSTLANGVTRFGLTTDATKKALIPLPPLPEQEKIAEILSCWDEGIEKLDKLIKAKQKRKKALMQQLLTGKKRFEEYKDEKWNNVKFSKIFKRLTRKNPEHNDNVLTISAQEGLISQYDYYNKRVASENLSNYTLVKNGEFAYNKSYSAGYPMGAIKRLDQYPKGVVSSLYICFAINSNDVDSEFLAQYFEAGEFNHEIHKIAQEGARNHGLLNVSASDFFNSQLHIPSLPEQKKIGSVLKSADDEINLLEEKLSQLKNHKKGLMQKLLTGEVRVKLN